MTRVLVVGETLVDVVRRAEEAPVELPGGSAANAAVALARLGVEVSLATALGRDRRGALLRQHLDSEGVAWAVDPLVLDRTAVAEAEIDDRGTATYRFDLAWRLSPDVAGLGDEGAEPPDALLVSSLAPVLDPGAAQVVDLVTRLGRRCPVVYDVNARPAITGAGPGLWEAVRTMAALADVVKASDEDLGVLLPSAGPVEAARTLLQAGAGAVALTLGEDGSAWVDLDGVVELGAPPVEVVDTIGAGDTYGAGLLAGLLREGLLRPGERGHRWPRAGLLAALDLAGRAAAVTVSRAGADPPTLSEVEG
ncbi:carbohydrate kinase family protein [Nocardioides campestrisoli]|uniref:carbohydrate kinase family protein n=1 Tax=Nocardioides campestrisoli TaxID=2736757 RepID=UPI001C62A309|nr:PfkB family carbohydrate kinase [Nocardioides campestrisoli]